jgi:hypothetical protein
MKTFAPFLAVAVCVWMYIAYIGPGMISIKDLIAKKDGHSKVLTELNDLKDKRDALVTKYNNLSDDDIAKLAKIVPEKFDTVLFINDLSNIAGQFAVNLKNIEVTPQDASNRDDVVNQVKAPYKSTKFKFSVAGPYTNFIAFISKLETSLRLIDVTSLDISVGPASTKTGEDNLSYVVELTVYSLR